jgi:hypothetical protein
MMRGRGVLVPAVATCLVVGAHAQVKEIRPYTEKESPNTPVRGHAVVGVSLMPGPGDQEQDRLFLYTPSRQGQVLSVDVTTANGRVQGDALVQLEAGTGRWTELKVPKRFRRADPEGLAVGVQSPNDPSGAFYIAAWGRAPTGPLDEQELWLYVNRGRAPQVFLYWNAEAAQGQACVPATVSSSLRFNTICKVRMRDVRADGKLKLVRRDGGNAQSQDVVLVR